MTRITVYEKPTCSTCQRLVALLAERGVEFDRVDLFRAPLSEQQLGSLLRRAGLRPRDVVRIKELGARALDLEDDAGTLAALAQHPELIQRPLVERGEQVVLARPPEAVLDLLG